MKNNLYIQKYKKLIDIKAAALSDYVSSGDLSISCIIKSLSGNSNSDFQSTAINEHINDLLTIKSNWSIQKDGDLLGYIYQELKCSVSKKQTGQFFTPPDVVQYIINNSLNNISDPENAKILDPACGSGQFLSAAFFYLKKLYIEKGFSEAEASKKIVTKNLFGLDIDPTAIIIAKDNLASISGIKKTEDFNIIQNDFIFRDEMNLTGNKFSHNDFTHIMGNPPWGSKFSVEEKKYYKKNYLSAKSGLNSFSLFLERSQEFIIENGIIAFQIPEALLNIKAHQNIRNDILSKFSINSITLWGDIFKNVYAPSISFIIKRSSNQNERKQNIVSIQKQSGRESNYRTLIPQDYYTKTFQNIFTISYSKLSVSLSDIIHKEDCTYLHNRAAFFLGIVTGNNGSHLSPVATHMHTDPIIIGADLKPYQINYSQHYFSYNPQSLQQTAPQRYYLTQNKILYKFIGKKLTFALDRNGLYSLNNVNGFIPLIHEINPETIISILNSSLMQYYYENTFFTLKVLKGNLARLPIKRITRTNQLLIKKYHDILSLEKPENGIEYKQKIEDIIFHEYGLNERLIEEIKTGSHSFK